MRKYEVRPARVQQDSTSCGFWVITLALLWACGVPIARSEPGEAMTILRNLGISQIKSYWKAIWTSWRIEEKGLGERPLLELMINWDMEFEEPPKDGCVSCLARRSIHAKLTVCSIIQVAVRPPWIPRFDPDEAKANISAAVKANISAAKVHVVACC